MVRLAERICAMVGIAFLYVLTMFFMVRATALMFNEHSDVLFFGAVVLCFSTVPLTAAFIIVMTHMVRHTIQGGLKSEVNQTTTG